MSVFRRECCSAVTGSREPLSGCTGTAQRNGTRVAATQVAGARLTLAAHAGVVKDEDQLTEDNFENQCPFIIISRCSKMCHCVDTPRCAPYRGRRPVS